MNRILRFAEKFSFLLDKDCKYDDTLIRVQTEPKYREDMLSFSLILSDSRHKGKIASLRIYFPFDEIATVDFSDPGHLMILLRAFKQESLISELQRFLWSLNRAEEPSDWSLLTNQAVA